MAICRSLKLLQRYQKGMVFSIADPVPHGSGIDFGRQDPDPGGQKLPTKLGKKSRNVLKGRLFSFQFCEGFSCSMGELYGGNCIFLSHKIIFLFSCNFIFILWSSKPCIWVRIRIRIRIDLKCLIWIRIRIDL